MSAPQPPPGWYPDPTGTPGLRYFDGRNWTACQPTPYAAPGIAQLDWGRQAGSKPKVITWYKIYCGVMIFIALLLIFYGLLLLLLDPIDTAMESSEEAIILGVTFLIIGTIFVTFYAIPLVARPRPWGWVYGFVAMGLGMTSCCSLPAAIPLLIYWLKPETKAYFEPTMGPPSTTWAS